MNKFKTPSKIQQKKFKEVCGYPYIEGQVKGKFNTDRPNNKKWDYSPWQFSFVFQQKTGYLICELTHRMTNNRTYGWDMDGHEIDSKIIEKIYPSYF